MSTESSAFSDKLRVRSCGLLVESESILLAQIQSPVTGQLIWTPPGGGIGFGESVRDGLEREFQEETNLEVEVGRLLHINELIRPPFHALECYFEVKRTAGELRLGADPELFGEEQLLEQIDWIPLDQLNRISFAPESLRKKLMDWNSRDSFPVFPGDGRA